MLHLDVISGRRIYWEMAMAASAGNAQKRPAPGTPGGAPPPVAKARVAKSAGPGGGGGPAVSKAIVKKASPAANVAKAPAIPPAAETEDAAATVVRSDTWRDFEKVDPLYALLGEVSQDKVTDADGNLREETLRRYLEILMVQKAAKKAKDWIEVWAAMDIPVTSQAQVMEPILRFGLQHAPENLGEVMAELMKGHRVKTQAMQEALKGAFSARDVEDRHGILREMLFGIFPKGPQSEWGWSRVGWSWQEWWKIVERVFELLGEANAFDELAALLDKIETEGKKPLVEQPLVWKGERLASARALLCKLGGVEETDLAACLDATLI